MKKLLLSGFVLLSLSAVAQDEILDTVLVSASKTQVSLMDANRNVIVLKGEEISNAPVESVAELLDFAIGVDARQRGSYGTQTDLSIRGGTFEQVLVLINGVRLGDPQTGHHLMNLPVAKEEIERIEILLGGGSYIFGATAFSGAINIITKTATKDATRLNLDYGSYNSYKLGFSQSLVGEKHRTSVAINTATSDGFKTNTDFDQSNISANSVIKTGNSELHFTGGYSWQNFGAQNFYSTNFPEQYEKTKTLFLSAGLKTDGKVTINREVYWRRNWDEFQLYREGDDFYQYDNSLFIKGTDTAATWYKGHNYHRSDILGGKMDLSLTSQWGTTSLSGDFRYEGIVSNNLGESLEAPINIEGSRGFYNLGDSRNNVSLAAEQSKTIHRFDLSAALLFNYNTQYDAGFYPAITAGYNFNNRQKIYGSVNRSFRLPSYTDLYYKLGGAVGSKDLQPEESMNYEIGYKYLSSTYFFNVSVFRRNGTNIIDWVQYCDTCDLLASNISEVNFSGLDATFRLLKNDLMALINMDYLELGYSFLTTDTENFDYQSLYVFDYLKNKFVLNAQHTFYGKFHWNYSLSVQDRNGDYLDAELNKLTAYPLVFLVNTRLSYQLKKFEINATVENLLNKTYYDRGNVELPGAWVWAGVKVKL